MAGFLSLLFLLLYLAVEERAAVCTACNVVACRDDCRLDVVVINAETEAVVMQKRANTVAWNRTDRSVLFMIMMLMVTRICKWKSQ